MYSLALGRVAQLERQDAAIPSVQLASAKASFHRRKNKLLHHKCWTNLRSRRICVPEGQACICMVPLPAFQKFGTFQAGKEAQSACVLQLYSPTPPRKGVVLSTVLDVQCLQQMYMMRICCSTLKVTDYARSSPCLVKDNEKVRTLLPRPCTLPFSKPAPVSVCREEPVCGCWTWRSLNGVKMV